MDLAVAGDRLLVFGYSNMGEEGARVAAYVRVYDNQSGAFVSQFGVRTKKCARWTGTFPSRAFRWNMLYITSYSF